MAYKEVVRNTISIITKARIPYAIVGGLAAGYYGSARSTKGVDLITTIDEKVQSGWWHTLRNPVSKSSNQRC